jgi:tetratricopeptide (TPR) repeat protein
MPAALVASPPFHPSLARARRALRSGRLDEATRHCLALLERDPTHADALHLAGIAAYRSGALEDARALLERTLELSPGLADAWNDLGVVLRASGEPERAIRCLREAGSLEPAHRQARLVLGCALLDLGRNAEAIMELRGALANRYGAERAEILSVLSVALRRQGEASEAAACAKAAIAIAPGLAAAHNNLAHALSELGDIDAALNEYDAALAIDPGYRLARWNRALLHLAMGRYSAGWRDYRLNPNVAYAPGMLSGDDRLPGDLSGVRLCVTRNQGIGDEIFFLRFAALAKARGARIAYRTEPRMAALLCGVACIDELVASDGPQADEAQWHLVDHLPHLLGHSDGDAPTPTLPIEPQAGARRDAAAALAAAGSGPYLGVAWRAGGTRSEVRAAGERGVTLEKRVPIEALARAVSGWRGTVVVLQRRPDPGELEAFRAACAAQVADLSGANEELGAVHALLAEIDEYVSVSNTNVHLRAAAGRGSHVLVPWFPEWRWGLSGCSSSWFPGSRIYRQAATGEWTQAFEALMSLGNATSRASPKAV